MYTIRRLNVGEAELYRAIRLESLKDSPQAFTSTYESALNRDSDSWTAQADGSALGSDRAIFIVLADRPIGLAGIYRDPKDHCCGELLQMWVLPHHRGNSIAAALLDHLFTWASHHDFHSIRAEVTVNNTRALRFYEKYGFRKIVSRGNGSMLTKDIAQHEKVEFEAVSVSP
jgi:ribosomal protein S18 acetylase RimI-like enzyme